MIELRSLPRIFMLACLCIAVPSSAWELQAQEGPNIPIRGTVAFGGVEREYFVQRPQNFDPDKLYWLLVVVHGGGGNGRTFIIASGVPDAADELGLDAIVVAPSFSNTDFLASRFPVLGEGAFLKRVIEELRGEYRLRTKILLMGYSRGGQFTHRFALRNPDHVEACAPFASGTWTTPDGRLLIQSVGEVRDPESFLTSETNATAVPERLRDLFEPRVARVAGLHAKSGAEDIPFLVMCGTLDPRFDIAQQFARSLEAEGYMVQTEWSRTPHGCRDDEECRAEFQAEFEKYSRSAVEFFLRVTEGK